MPRLIVLLSGRICTGKTTLAKALADKYGFRRFSTREALISRAGEMEISRKNLQEFGEKLDRRTKGSWLRDSLLESIAGLDSEDCVVIDSIRIHRQADFLRESYGSKIVHVHLDCSDEELSRRYAQRSKDGPGEFATFAEAQQNRTERGVHKLGKEADISIRTDRSEPPEVLVRVVCHLGLRGGEFPQHVDVLVGGQYGSEGKGQIVAYLAREYDLLVRVGGPNAGHKVFELPKPYTFHQLPSGTRSSSAKLLIGPGAAINLETLLREINDCGVDPERLAIDPLAILITEADRKSEAVIKASIGSTGSGTGAAAIRRIQRLETNEFAKDSPQLKPFIKSAIEVLEEARCENEKVLLEGTQGTGLSIFHGHYPHVTSRDTTVSGCLAESGIPPRCVRKVVVVCRTFPIRVQSPEKATSGPMSKEITLEEMAIRSGIDLDELKKTERTSTTNRERRIAEFDWVQLQRSSALNGPTDIALTFADYLDIRNRNARRFDQLTPETILFIREVEKIAGAPASLISTGFNNRAIIDRRTWAVR